MCVRAKRILARVIPVMPPDYLEAVAAHPAIGDKQALRDKFAPSRSGWEDKEQATAAGASEVGGRRAFGGLQSANFLFRGFDGVGRRGK